MPQCKYGNEATRATASARTTRRHDAKQCVCYREHTAGSASNTPATGESETHNPDGSSNYTRFSEQPWGHDDYRAFIASKGQDPDKVTFSWGWTSNATGSGFWNKLNNVRPIPEVESDKDLTIEDLPALYAAAETSTPRPTSTGGKRATVIVYADPQIGKVGRRGGTPELIERSTVIRRKLDQHLATKHLQRILIADAGDGFEGFESGGNPMFTNDLSLAQQMDTYGTELFKFINIAHKHAPASKSRSTT